MNRIAKPHFPYAQVFASVLLVLLAAAPGCAHRRSAGASGFKPGQESGRADPFGSPTAAGEFGGGGFAEDVPLSGRPSQISFDSPQVRKDLFPPVAFAFDRYNIAPGERAKIGRVAEHLRSQPGGVIVAGHTDSIGTTEYNRNLGERRALAVRAALLEQGVDASRVQTLSFGEDRPAQPGNSETALAANRRAEFGLFNSVSP